MKVIKFPKKNALIDSNGILVANLTKEEEREADFEKRMQRIKESLAKISELMGEIKNAQKRSDADN